MLKRNLNYAVIDFTIAPLDPILVKSNQSTVSGVDMSFVQTYRRGDKAEPFIPGSSLKGVIRSYAEKICRSLRAAPVPVCLPYLQPGNETPIESGQASCGFRMKEIEDNGITIPSSDAYKISCPICKIFGSHQFIGRLSTSDGYVVNKFILENRDGVAIDRFTGGAASGAIFDLEVLTSGDFRTKIEIHNFENWQLGLIGLVLRDMEDGLIRIGMGKSRGLGRIKASIDTFSVAYWGKPSQKLVGMHSLCTPEEIDLYGFIPETAPESNLGAPTKLGLRHVYDITDNWKDLLSDAVSDLDAYIKSVSWPDLIDNYQVNLGD